MKTAHPLLYTAIFLLCACTARTSGRDIVPEEAVPVASKPWYYFSDQGIHAVASPSDIPSRPFVPWTEAVRVADTAILPETPAFLINRLGIMTPGTDYIAPVLATDPVYFTGQTAAGFVLTGTRSAVQVYRNSFFSTAAPKAHDTYLLDYSPLTTGFSPLSRISNLSLPVGTQCSALDYEQGIWYGAFKIERENHVEFLYRTFSAMPPEHDTDPASGRSIDAAEYQQAVAPGPYTALPEKVLALLSGIPGDIPLSIKVYPAQKGTTRTHARGKVDERRNGYAFISGPVTAVLFSDGTLYIQKDSMHVFKLPGLSAGYQYTGFLLSGRVLLAAWEEQRFYQTGRAGILEIMLPDGVY